ncbi:Methyltransferase [[Actinomadura] parvosata subsp. kistnae]|uniref:Methyltransferase domain-containing protein n=1 Tax=[Actinomadura] parvosata subsp. kistnae TaxID=1909395 RepID=A0A1U9ZX37_9ACTN|nr:class I SAM-dependent methyltransferase [Nonomuraea sp. ATCC 55076]AQZ62479.1 hypothetical protein BKM31_14310 [Nonomuraea sp. ATCC 55076]SPL88717.1 Methyltransferase [Actinomadura parvosata subsp. kistnae]
MQQVRDSDGVRDAYDRSAAFYDQVTQADDYDRWVALYLELLREHGVTPGGRLADLGCGTGKGALRLAGHGFEVTGIDLSPRMLDVARGKRGAGRVRFVQGDLRCLPEGLGPFEVAVTMGEPLNHLRDEDELAAAFAQVARVLAPGGLFLFDVNTAGFYRRLAGVRHVVEDEGSLVLHRGFAAHEREGAELRVDHFRREGSEGGDGARWTRTHVLYSWAYFAPATVERLLAAAGLAQVAAYGLDAGGLRPGGDECDDRKRLVVARSEHPGRHGARPRGDVRGTGRR